MGSKNQLRARLRGPTLEAFEDLKDDREGSRTDTERVVVRAGLQHLGYLDEQQHEADMWLEDIRKVGVAVGAIGMTIIGYGLFGSVGFRYLGFAVVLAGFALIVGAEFAPSISGFLNQPRGWRSRGESRVKKRSWHTRRT